MLTRIKRLPSPALVISVIALVVAVGGGTFAIAALNSGKVKKIAKKQANKQIKKKAPGLSVNRANEADNAITTDAVTSFTYAGDNGSTNQTFLNDFHGLTLTGSCTAGANQGATIKASSGTPDAEIAYSGISQNTSANNDSVELGSTPTTILSPTSTVKTTNGTVNIGFASGQMVYSQPGGGSRVSVNWFYRGGLGAPSSCYFSGTVTGTDNGPGDVGKARASTADGSGLSAAERVNRAR